jgi:hypothetical protein
MSTTAPDTTTTEAIDLDALRASAEARLEQLREQAQRLSPESFTDDKIAAELADVESEMAAAQTAVDRIDRAHTEEERRAVQGEADAEKARRKQAMVEAGEWDAKKHEAAVAFDQHAKALAEDLSAYAESEMEIVRCMSRAGRKPLWTPPSAVVSGMLFAMQAANCPRGILNFEGANPKAAPLSGAIPDQPTGE